MKKTLKSKRAAGDPIAAYSRAQPLELRNICDLLRKRIDAALPKASSKVWHGSPVWFVGENPVVGYSVTAKQAVSLLFWNGQAFDEEGLESVGKYRAAQAKFADAAEVDAKVLRRWLKKAESHVFDSKGFFAKLRAKRAKK